MSAVRCEGVVIIQCCNGRSVVLHILVPTSLQYRTIVHCIVLLRDVLSITMFDEFFVDFGKNAFFVFLSNLRLFYRLLRNARYNGHSANHGSSC